MHLLLIYVVDFTRIRVGRQTVGDVLVTVKTAWHTAYSADIMSATGMEFGERLVRVLLALLRGWAWLTTDSYEVTIYCLRRTLYKQQFGSYLRRHRLAAGGLDYDAVAGQPSQRDACQVNIRLWLSLPFIRYSVESSGVNSTPPVFSSWSQVYR